MLKIGSEVEIIRDVPDWLPIKKGDRGCVVSKTSQSSKLYPYDVYFGEADVTYAFSEDEIELVDEY